VVFLYLLAGTFFGAIAASLSLWAGASVLFALFSYSFVGAISAVIVAFGMFLLGEAQENAAEWDDSSEADGPVSA